MYSCPERSSEQRDLHRQPVIEMKTKQSSNGASQYKKWFYFERRQGQTQQVLRTLIFAGERYISRFP